MLEAAVSPLAVLIVVLDTLRRSLGGDTLAVLGLSLVDLAVGKVKPAVGIISRSTAPALIKGAALGIPAIAKAGIKVTVGVILRDEGVQALLLLLGLFAADERQPQVR